MESVLRLQRNKNVKIIKRDKCYIIICLDNQKTPGVFSKISVKKNTRYFVELSCKKISDVGSPGLWIGDRNKNTLHFNNFFTVKKKGTLIREFNSGNNDILLIGALIKNSKADSCFLLYKLNVQINHLANNDDNGKSDEKDIEKIIEDVKEGIKENIKKKDIEDQDILEKYLDLPSTTLEEIKPIEISSEGNIKPNIKSNISINIGQELNQDQVLNLKENLKELNSIFNSKEDAEEKKKQSKGKLEKKERKKNLKKLSKQREQIEKKRKENKRKLKEASKAPNRELTDSDCDDLTDADSEEFYGNDNVTSAVRIDEITENVIGECKYSYDDIEHIIPIRSSIENGFKLYPISLGIPEELIISKSEIKKNADVFSYDEGFFAKKNRTESEKKQYYENLRNSKFVMIRNSKNSLYGKDDPIFYEAFAFGCVPIIANEMVGNGVDNTSCFFPKFFLNLAKKSFDNENGKKYFSFEFLGKILDKMVSKNKTANNFILQYAKKYLTTRVIAQYLLSFASKNISKVLFVAHSKKSSDFLLQMSLLHGLKSVLGDINVVDYPKVSLLYKNSSIDKNKETRFGMPYAKLLKDNSASRGRIDKRIANKEFDLILIMGIFTEEDRKRVGVKENDFPFSNEIYQHYDYNDIFFINGNSTEKMILPNKKHVMKFYNEKGLCFIRNF